VKLDRHANRIENLMTSTPVRWSEAFDTATVSAMSVYDDILVPRLFDPWARLLIDRLALEHGEAVLDVACGPGTVTRIAAERVGAGGRVTGCDLSGAMLAVAEAKPPVSAGAPINYVQASAERLPCKDAAVDVVTCQQGLQFFVDREAAVAEMHRALRPGGRVGITVWAEIDGSPAFAALADAIAAVAGTDLAARYRGGPWGFPDADHLGALLEDAGLQGVDVSTHALSVIFEGGPSQLVATLAATPLATDVERLSAEQKQGLVDHVARTAGAGAIESQLEANVALARKTSTPGRRSHIARNRPHPTINHAPNRTRSAR
jgi:SAM-dependent methyltransferase